MPPRRRTSRTAYRSFGSSGSLGWNDGYFPPKATVAVQASRAARAATRLDKGGETLQPVRATGYKIAQSFWGRAWCDNLERYSDYANRLPRGRTYLRSGAVVDLRQTDGELVARVVGSDVYRVSVTVKKMSPARLRAVVSKCAGTIDSLLELLAGKLSDEVMKVVTEPRRGLFPEPKEIEFHCSCPDAASMCKHVAAVLYGVAVRLDQTPALLFALRGVDPELLVTEAVSANVGAAGRPHPSGRELDAASLSDVFGIEIDGGVATAPTKPTKKSKVGAAKRSVRVPAAEKARRKR